MDEVTKGALTDALLELSVNELVAIQYQLNKGKMVEEIMDHNLEHVTDAIDECGLRYCLMAELGQRTPFFSTSGKFFRDLDVLIEKLLRMNHEVVTTNGCFDVIHAGHVQYLEQCKAYGDFLLVMVNGNRRVTETKGPERPFMDVEERVALICSLEAVNAVVVFEQDTPIETLTKLCEHGIIPAAHIKSGGYTDLEELPEHQLLLKYGSAAHIISPLEGHSTTDLVDKIRNSGGGDKWQEQKKVQSV